MMDDEPERMDPRCDAGGRGYMLWMEYCNDGEYIRATDYDALAAKLAEVKASSQGWIDAAVEQQVRRKRAEARLLEVEVEKARAEAAEARIAHLENHIEGVAKDTHKIMVAYEAALPAAYRLAMGDAARRVEARGAVNPFSAGQYANSAFVIRRLPTPTAAELMARINAPKPRSSDACDFCGYNVQKPCKTKVDRQNCEFAP